MNTKTVVLLSKLVVNYVSANERDLVFAGITAHDNGNIFHLFKLYVLKTIRFSPDSGIARHFSWWE
jgi:hypothetical protein